MNTTKSILILLLGLLVACNRQPAHLLTDTPTVAATSAAPVATAAATGISISAGSVATAAATVIPTPHMITRGTITLQSCLLRGYIQGFCGTFSVLENRDALSGRRIALRIVVLAAKQPPVEPDPVFFLAGGPGGADGAATQHWLSSRSMFPGLNDHRDIVLIDQRGTGGSNAIAYPPLPDIGGLTVVESEKVMRDWITKELAALDADPRYYTTAVAMDDVDDVRAALGYERINLFGGSYGATAAQVYLRRHESHVRSVVLDGGSLLDVPMFERFAPNAQRALDLLLVRCEADETCHSAFPAIRQELDALMARVRQHPVTIQNPGSDNAIVLTPSVIGGWLQGSLQDGYQTAALPKDIHAVYRSIQSVQANQATGQQNQELSNDPIQVMRWEIVCSEYWARRNLEEVARLSTGTLFQEWALDDARQQDAICRVIPRGIVEAEEGARVTSRVPVLILNGEADPMDPPEHVSNAERELPTSLTLIVPGAGHTVGHLGCLPNVVTQFIQHGSAAGLEVGCVKDYQPPPFEVGE